MWYWVLPISQAGAGLFTAPLFVVIFSVIIFRETVGPRRSFAVALGFAGILLVLRPDAQGLGWVTFFPILSGAFHAIGIIMTRKWCEEEGTLTLLAAFFGFMMIAGCVGLLVVGAIFTDVPAGPDGFVFRGWVPFAGTFMIIVLVQGVGSLIGVGLIIKAYQMAESSFIAVFENAMIVAATLWAIILWKEVPDMIGVLGLACIIISGIIISIRSDQTQTT